MFLQRGCVCVCPCPCKRHAGVWGCVTFIPGSKRLGVPARGVWVCVSLSLQEACGCVWVCNVYPRFQEAWRLPGM